MSHECEPICPACLRRAAADIAALPADYLALMQRCPRQPALSEVKIARPHPQGYPPIDLRIDALCADICWKLTCWEPPVREALRLPAERTRRVRPGWQVQQAAALLAAHAEILAGLPPILGYAEGLAPGPVERDGRFAIASLRGLHARARGLLGAARLIMALPGDCSACGQWALRRADGSETVYCEACEQRWSWQDYRRYVTLTTTAMGA